MILECKNLKLGYESKTVISDLSFSLEKGDYLSIIGENGSGKSTLMKTVLGLMKPMSGEIIFSDGLKKNEIGYLPQQTVVQKDFPASVEEVVMSGCLNKKGFHPFYSKSDREKCVYAMKSVGISDLRKKSYRQLSGGQQQRTLLARALCATGKMLLLDEPVTGLDTESENVMYYLINALNKQGITVIMITHDLSAALKYSNKILSVGEENFFGTKEEYLEKFGGEI